MKPIAAVVTDTGPELAKTLQKTVLQLQEHPLVTRVAIASTERVSSRSTPSGCDSIGIDTVWSSAALQKIYSWLHTSGGQDLLWLAPTPVDITPIAIDRLWSALKDSAAGLAYGDYLEQTDQGLKPHPLIDYQPGAIRDDFDFGPLLLLNGDHLPPATEQTQQLLFGGLYDLRLRLSEKAPLLHLPEPLYAVHALDERRTGEKVFDYVDPKNRDYQVEMESIASAHLKRIGAWLPQPSKPPIASGDTAPVLASIVIPVRNRVNTVGEAVDSALAQQAEFDFNVIVVDNHSDDGTAQLLAEKAAQQPRLRHLIPERHDLGIGGCWNHAVFSADCGQYAVQLDSDDIYDGNTVLQQLVDKLQQGYAMVVGSYTTVDFQLQELPPGLIDHREWSDSNGHNNVLRIHGMGAPRAFHVATLRQFGFPNVSYGEDYAAVLQLTRSYRIGRIYHSLYWCRRWEGNTDSALPLATANKYALYKDRLRSIEIAARQQERRS